MMHPSFDLGRAFGRIETRLSQIEAELSSLKSYLKRGAILAGLWLGALLTNAGPDQIAVMWKIVSGD